ncbi:hypothetical protein CRUP_020878, partial [Coryphaenoides rupestris]
NVQKPKKKKEETNGVPEAKSNGAEAKPKKSKAKKSEGASGEEGLAVQSQCYKLQ